MFLSINITHFHKLGQIQKLYHSKQQIKPLINPFSNYFTAFSFFRSYSIRMDNLKFYIPPKPEIYSGYRTDEVFGSRFSHVVQCINVTDSNSFDKLKNVQINQSNLSDNQSLVQKSIAIVGFCSDEGVRRNFGRVGARDGPFAIRQALKGLPLHIKDQNGSISLYDCGDIAFDKELEEGQIELGKITRMLSQYVDLVFVLGGGHEVAYGHFLGQWQGEKTAPGIFNFDAHFDLRKMDQASSGTPFLQIYELCKEKDIPFHYQVLGIQKASNTNALFETAKVANVKYLETEEISSMSMNQISTDFVQPFINNNDKIYVTICMDVFNGGFAPGVSAVNGFGLQPYQVIKVLRELIQSGKVKHIDIAELNPLYDNQSITAKLAAMLFNTSIEELLKL